MPSFVIIAASFDRIVDRNTRETPDATIGPGPHSAQRAVRHQGHSVPAVAGSCPCIGTSSLDQDRAPVLALPSPGRSRDTAMRANAYLVRRRNHACAPTPRPRLGQGIAAEAIRILAASPTRNWGYLAIAYSRAGRRAEAETLVTEAPAL